MNTKTKSASTIKAEQIGAATVAFVKEQAAKTPSLKASKKATKAPSAVKSTKPIATPAPAPASAASAPHAAPVPVTAATLAAQLASIAPAAPAPSKRAKYTGQMVKFAKDFKPKTNNLLTEDSNLGRFAQFANWSVVCAYLEDNDGQATTDELVEAITVAAKTNNYEPTCNARGFIAGRIRGGHLAVVV